MKNLLRLLLICFSVGFISCQEEINEETTEEVASSTSKKLTQTDIDNLKEIVTTQETTIVYPIITLIFNTNTQDTESRDFNSDEKLLTFLSNINQNNQIVSLQYPIVIKNENNEDIEIQGQNDLSDKIEIAINSIENNVDYLNVDEIALIASFVDTKPENLDYPITVVLFFKGSGQSSTSEIEDQPGFYDILASTNTDQISISIKYPITLFNNLQEEITIDDNEEFLFQINELTSLQSVDVKVKAVELGSENVDIIQFFLIHSSSDFEYPVTINEIANNTSTILRSQNEFKTYLFQLSDNTSANIQLPVAIFDGQQNRIEFDNFKEFTDKIKQLTDTLTTNEVATILNFAKSTNNSNSIHFPIKTESFFKDENQNGNLIINDNSSLISFLEGTDFNNVLLGLQYPIEIFNELQEVITVNNNDELLSHLK
ncbi:hypothetical protein ACXGQW_06290 [Wenyingzhuangia sp. IMCC45533]